MDCILRIPGCGVVALGLVVALVTAPVALAQQVVVIWNDRGGYVGERARIVDNLRANQVQVEIRGDICYSSCTMYLGAGDVCITPDTVFGFHGPSRDGQPLDAEAFDRWSRVMARYYTEPIRNWFLTTARYERTGVYEIRGAELMRYGYRAC